MSKENSSNLLRGLICVAIGAIIWFIPAPAGVGPQAWGLLAVFVATIAGFILHFYQKFPKVNETIQIENYTFKVIRVTATKIELVRMTVDK